MAISRFMILLCIFCICFLRPAYSQEFIIAPSTVILFPGEISAQFLCQVNPVTVVSWEVNGTRYGLDEIFDGDLPGHNISGTNVTVLSPMNGTKYVCVIPAIPPALPILSAPAFLHIAHTPDSVLSVTIDPRTVNVNITNNIVNFTLEWDEPFDNFDPILNYTVIITCTNVTGCPVMFTTNITSLDVSLMTNLAMMNHSITITASNSIGKSNATTRFIIVPGVDMVYLDCTPVDIENECTVTWNVTIFGNDIIEAPITYNVYYFGDNITSGSLGPIDSTMAVIRNLPANNSDVNVNVVAMNVFGSGRNGTASDTIMARPVIGTTSRILNPNILATIYSAVVLCEIDPTGTADYCQVFARDDTITVYNSASVMDDMMAIVTISPLACQRLYTIAAQGLNGGEILGPLFRQETVTASMCPTTTVVIPSTSVDSTAVLVPTITSIPLQTTPATGPASEDDDGNTGAVVGGVVGGILGAIVVIIIIIVIVYCCMKHREKSSRSTSPGNTPMAISNIPLYDDVQDPEISDTVKMKPNPAYQGLPSDHLKMETNPAYQGLTSDQVKMEPNPAYQLLASNQANKGPNPAYQDLSSYCGRASVSKQKPAENVNYYEEIVNEQNITVTKNSSSSVP